VAKGTRYCTGATKKDALCKKTFALIAKMKACIRNARTSGGATML
jgi:hypothetical protein